MKKFILMLISGFAIGMSLSQAAILNKKEIKNVHKVALVSFITPKRILVAKHDGNDWVYIDPNQDKVGESLGETSWAGKEQPESELQHLYDNALATFQSKLTSIANWQFIPYESISSNPAYIDLYKNAAQTSNKKAPEVPAFLKKLGVTGGIDGATVKGISNQNSNKNQNDFRVANGMHFIPLSTLSDGAVRFGDDPFKGQKMLLAKLAQDLNVDAVALIEVRLSHRYGKLANLKIGENVKGVPRIGSSLIVVSKDGKIAAETGDIKSKIQDDFEGETVNISRDGKMLLDTPEVRTSFESTIIASAQKMKDVLEEAFSKIK